MKAENGILIFNNGDIDLGLVSAMMEAEDCTVYLTSQPLEVIHLLQTKNIDVILASSHLEGMEGIEFKELVERICPGVSIFLLPPYLKTGGDGRSEFPTECTVNLKEFVYFIHNHIRSEKHLQEDSSRFKNFFFSFTDRLLQIFEVNDKYFFNNVHMVADLSVRIALQMKLDDQLVDSIHLAAMLRDIGKIGIQNEILNGSARLDDGDFEAIKYHPLNSVQILKSIDFPWNIELIIRHHHEQYNGKGYPDGLKGRSIPLGSRIIAIADAYVAMTTDRPYRIAKSAAEASEEIVKMAGTQFDPEIVEIFTSVADDMFRVSDQKISVLLIAIDDRVAAYLRLNLNSQDFLITSVENFSETMSMLSKITPDLILVADHFVASEGSILCTDSKLSEIRKIVFVENGDLFDFSDEQFVAGIVKPYDLDELIRKIQTLHKREPHSKVPVEHGLPVKGVSGSLEDMSLSDIIQVLNMGMKTAKLHLANGNDSGSIYLKNGKIVFVESGEKTGADAFYNLMEWQGGTFRVYHGMTIDRVNVTVETMTLLLEASRVMDEKRYKANRAAILER